MYGRRYQRKRGFKRTVVMLLTLVMLASVCFPGLRASAEGETVDLSVEKGKTADYAGVSEVSQINSVTVLPEGSGLSVTAVEGKLVVNAENAVAGTYDVSVAYNKDLTVSFKVQVTETVVEGNESVEAAQMDQAGETNKLVENGETQQEINGKTETEQESNGKSETEQESNGETETELESNGKTETEQESNGKTETEQESNGKTEVEQESNGKTETEQSSNGDNENTNPEVSGLVMGNEAALLGLNDIMPLAYTSLDIEQGQTKSVKAYLYYEYNYRVLKDGKDVTNEAGIQAEVSYEYCSVSVGDYTEPGLYTVQWGTISRNGAWSTVYSIDVTVTERSSNEKNRPAAVFFLKLPTNDPISNAVGQWSDSSVTYDGANASVNMTGAKWEDRIYEENGVQKTEKNKNVFENVSSFIISWPDGSTGATWTLDKTTYSSEYRQVYNAYKASLESDLGITDLTLDDIESITLIPFKISQNNGGSVPTHIDCKVSVVCKKAFTATFYVKEPGKNIYEIKHSENYKIVNGSAEAIKQYTVSDSIVGDDGITYKFDGWHVESVDGAIATWDYHPTEQDLEDGEVNFYAHYVPVTTSITITKTVTGNMGDWNKEFTFNVNSGTENQTITLKNGERQIISGLTIGSDITVIESDNTGYTVTYRLSTDAEDAAAHTGSMAKTTVSEGLVIAFTNHKEAQIDTGVFTDTAPYILLFSIAAVGAAVLLLNKRRYQY